MPRPIRIKFENAWYHIMNRGAGRKPVFKTDEQRQLFVDLLSETSDRFEVEVHAYCLMGNHFHLLVRTPKPTLSDALKFLSSVYTRKFNRLESRDGPIFRSRYKSLLIDADDYLVEVSRYIHRNPLEAKITSNAVSYPWSSYPAYVHAREKPVWLHTGEVLKRVGRPNEVSGYRDLVESSMTPTLKTFYATNRLPAVLGSNEFKHYVSGFGFAQSEHEKRDLSLDDIFAAVIKQTGATRNCIVDTRKGQRGSSARYVAILIASQRCALNTEDISRAFNLTFKTFSVALSRARKAIFADARLVALCEGLRKSL